MAKHDKSVQRVKKENNDVKKTNKKLKGAVIGLAITTGVLALTTGALGISLGVTASDSGVYSTQLENIYEKNYYELVDSVNTADSELSKVLTSSDSAYQAKLLTEVADNAKNMQNNIANLPITGDNLLDSVKFINQLSGYAETLEEKLKSGESLTEDDLETLSEIRLALAELKENLNSIAQSMRYGYNILKASMQMDGNMNNFTIDFSNIKTVDVNYPTMIYDGPFSDSVVSKEIVGLTGDEVTSDEAKSFLTQLFGDVDIDYVGDTNGRFETYNFEVNTNNPIYVQVTKIGGYILTISGHSGSSTENLSTEDAISTALNFVSQNGITSSKVVWSDILNNQMYLNIAPVENDIILYPDLIKVKIDLENGDIIGYDAISYYTNHTDRDLSEAEEIEVEIPEEFAIQQVRLVLAPLDYNREVLCYEYECTSDGAVFYFYFNASTGAEENILKVVSTEEGSLLM